MDNYEINIKDAYEAYKKNSLMIIDIRTKKEWQTTGIIPNSKLVNMHDINYQEKPDFLNKIIDILNKNSGKKIVFICASGARSEIVVNYFLNKGYKNISHISEGIIGKENNGWLYLGYPLEALQVN